jgi:hemerythrin-like domain-containing protein
MTTDEQNIQPPLQSHRPQEAHPHRRAVLLASDAIPPDDDLMREHGVLKRVLLCYRAMTAQVAAGRPLVAIHVQNAALVIHDFIEGFHEGLEEGYVFPRLRQSGQLTATVTTLLTQHARGRVITQYLLARAAPDTTGPGGTLSATTSAQLSGAMQAFVRMYEPHEAREDTVVFPALRPGHHALSGLGGLPCSVRCGYR